jgi:N-acetylmuramoyl-L-alanine amidase
MHLTRRLFARHLTGAMALGAAAYGGRNAWADAPSALRGVALSASGGQVRVLLSLDQPVTPRAFFLQSPDRFVIDLPQTRLAMPISGQEALGSGLVTRYRWGVRPEGSARLVLDLAAPAALSRQSMAGRGQNPELSFDLAAIGPIAAQVRPQETAGRNGPRRVVVIDAGHGGQDPGAIGTTGVREKDVVLDAALLLRQALEARGNYRVALTRDADRFVPLPDRVRFARAQNADLFISLHADSHANPASCGASVYTLSERGADRAQTVMASQNWDLDLGDAPRRGVVGDILVDLAQRETTNRSGQFAETVIGRLGQVSPLLRNTHRNAGFFVLLAPDVPAVLIETGFLSNAADERRLASSRERASIAEAIAGAVDAHFAAPLLYARA